MTRVANNLANINILQQNTGFNCNRFIFLGLGWLLNRQMWYKINHVFDGVHIKIYRC